MIMNVKKYMPFFRSSSLFRDISAAELESTLECISTDIKTVRKGVIILHTGDKPKQVGIVLSGQLHIIREDYDGNCSLIAVLSSGDIFAEALCCAGVTESPVTVIADLDSTIILMSFERILETCPSNCSSHRTLIKNMLGLIAVKNLMLQNHMDILSLKSIRARVMRYFESFAPKHGGEIIIPLNREELANYLCVERSALSHELAKMKRDGLIEYKKNRFMLK